MLEEWLKRITGELAEYKAKHPEKKVAPFAVNQIVHSARTTGCSTTSTCARKYKGADPDHLAARARRRRRLGAIATAAWCSMT
jgi:hypothetical protein